MCLIKEAERPHNLITMSTRQSNTVIPIQSPSLTIGVLGKEDKLKCLFTMQC